MLLRDKKTLWGMFDSPLREINHSYKPKVIERANIPIYAQSVGYMGNMWGVNDAKTDVNHNIGLNTSFVYKCIDMRSNSVASAMLNQKLYYYYDSKNKEEIVEHPYFDVMRYVNDQYTPYDLWYLTQSSFDFIGRIPWWVETDDVLNIPIRITPILPDMGRFVVLKNEYGIITGYELHTGIKKITFTPFEIFFHTAVNINDSTYGFGLVNALIREANIDKLQKQKVLKLLENGGIGKAHVQFGGNPTGEVFARAKQDFDKANNGANREGGFIYTTESTKVTPLVDNSALEQAVGILGLTRDQIIQLSGVMRVSLGIGGSTTKADADTQYLVYLRDHITPLITNTTSRLSQDFVQKYYPQDSGWLCVEVDSILPDDELNKETIRRMKLETGQRKPIDFIIEDGLDVPDESEQPGLYKYYLTGGLIPIDQNSLDFTDITGDIKPTDTKETAPVMDKTKKQVALGASSIQDTALNGAQTTSLLSILQSVSDGVLPKDSAISTIMAAFPTIDEQEAGEMVNPVEIKPIQLTQATN